MAPIHLDFASSKACTSLFACSISEGEGVMQY